MTKLPALYTLMLVLLVAPIYGQAAPPCTPFQNVNGHTIVHVTINGSGPYAFILDTGSQSTMIDPTVADAAHVGYRGGAVVSAAGGKRIMTFYAVTSVMAGGKQASLRAIIYAANFKAADGVRVVGLLGQDFLESYKVTIDYAQGCFTLQ